MSLASRAALDAIRLQEAQRALRVKTKPSGVGLSSEQFRCIVDDDRPSVSGADDGLQNLLLRGL